MVDRRRRGGWRLSLVIDPAQALAADPTLNAFVTANAGSGKTKTLIDRVARLLLAGAPPPGATVAVAARASPLMAARRVAASLVASAFFR